MFIKTEAGEQISIDIGTSNTIRDRLTVKTEDGGRITLDIEPSWTIRDVKKKIQDQEGILPEQQLIVINDAEVDDYRAVSYYNIGNDSSIHLIKMGDATTIVAQPPVNLRNELRISTTSEYKNDQDKNQHNE
ncbi:unnamed protein product [Rotaria sordida]|uniref:Ubiquitin-like domain-containing protein n=1 Tax=Rotaria sordida TaxID=392033 RepID=A0A814H3U3_9BILA|nr:unnamed protein product [Rotaria sordida]CAF1004949.1 unnamed protein product [Rotaria sordida]